MANKNELLEAYIHGMQERAYPDEEVDIENLRTAYFSNDSITLLMTGLHKLKEQEKADSQLKNTRCQENVRVVEEISRDLGEGLVKLGISMLLGGSTLYDKPVKGDIDIAVVGDDFDTLVDADNLIQRHMKKTYGYHTDLDEINISVFDEYMETPADPQLADLRALDILWATSHALKILTWRPIIQNEDFKKYQEKASLFLTSNRLATATACMRVNWSLKKISK